MGLSRFRFLLLVLISFTIIPAAVASNFRTRLHQSNVDFSTEDISAEIHFGRNIAAHVLGRMGLWQNTSLTRYLNLTGNTLVSYTSRNELRFYFAILDSDIINAYSTPGGYIFITKGAFYACTDESELAAILAHEIAHIVQRHIVNALHIRSNDNNNFTSFTRLMGATTDTAKLAFSQVVDQALGVLFEQGYQIDQELEADRLALFMLAAAGYDPTALLRYLQRVDNLEATQINQHRTHPRSALRFSALEKIIQQESFSQARLAKAQIRFNQYINSR